MLRSTLKPSASWVVYLEMSHGMGQYFDGKHFAVNMTLEALPKINCRKQKWNITDTESASTCLVLCDKWIKSEKWPHQALWRDHFHNPKGFFSASHFSDYLQKFWLRNTLHFKAIFSGDKQCHLQSAPVEDMARVTRLYIMPSGKSPLSHFPKSCR